MEITNIDDAEIAIIGIGLMGASLAMALNGKCKKIIGIDTNKETCDYALKHGVVDEAYPEIDNHIESADIIVLATPISEIIKVVELLPSLHNGNPLVMDFGSTKEEILHAFASLPERFDVIGGHPVCGKEILSIKQADENLFKNKPFIFSPISRTSVNAINIANKLCELIGANSHIIPFKKHDIAFAATSHMPYIVSLGLLLSTPEVYKPMVGPGFQSMVRIANTPSHMMSDVIATNRENIVAAIDNFQIELSKLRNTVLEGDAKQLNIEIENGRKKYLSLISPM